MIFSFQMMHIPCTYSTCMPKSRILRCVESEILSAVIQDSKIYDEDKLGDFVSEE